jgi:hypothetical protein
MTFLICVDTNEISLDKSGEKSYKLLILFRQCSDEGSVLMVYD